MYKLYIYIYAFSTRFIQSDLRKMTKQFVKEPTTVVIHNTNVSVCVCVSNYSTWSVSNWFLDSSWVVSLSQSICWLSGVLAHKIENQ